MKVHLIRHAQSTANALHEWTGWRDAGLSDTGRREQLDLCARFKYPKADIYFTSPLKRCVESFRLIYRREPDLLCNMLKECALGILEGKKYTNLNDDPQYVAWLATPDLPIEGGESFSEFTGRVCAGFALLTAELRARGVESAAGVMHGNVMRALLHRFADEKIQHGEWQIPNGGVYTLKFDEKGFCTGWETTPAFLFC